MKATAFAPASVGNATVGFDILGFPLQGVGDKVTVEIVERNLLKDPSYCVQVSEVSGIKAEIPTEPQKNTAAVAVKKLITETEFSRGAKISIEKGIPMASGMGGSAASAVAAVVAMNALLPRPLEKKQLLPFALAGETAASGTAHADNVAPSLLGGMQLVGFGNQHLLIEIPVPRGIYCVLVHPGTSLETKKARQVLKEQIPLAIWTQQSSYLAAFIQACNDNNIGLLRNSMKDIIIEPQRAPFIQGFEAAKASAEKLKAIGFSISGAGPSVYCWAESLRQAEEIRSSLVQVFEGLKLKPKAWISPISSKGAEVLA